MRFLAALALSALSFSAASATTASWVDWTSSSGSTVYGTITLGAEIIDVTYTNTVANGFVQTGGGTDWWSFSGGDSPYTSVGPNGNINGPTGTDIIALGGAGTRTLSFSKEIDGLYLSYVSWNGQAPTFSETMTKLSETGKNIDGDGVDGRGYWGSGTLALAPGETTSGEPHGTLFTSASMNMFSFTTSGEFWHGFTVGVAGIGSGKPPVDPPVNVIPLPAAGFLLLGGLGGLAALRLRRKS